MNYLSYKPEYQKSWALIIGINRYENFHPLEHAKNDAKKLASILKNKFNFEEDKVTLLLDEKATRKNIMKSYFSYANDEVTKNDRIIIYFAGHGHTISANNNEVGFLIPVNGAKNELSTYIRWNELTTNSDLINAKHVFFIMDACYGGLAITRSLPAGTSRFLKYMLQRRARQVLTAGKANEKVSDSGGPLKGHSIFTGNLIQALEGEAADKDGVITANYVMSYLYEKVSKDIRSKQTPHYGYIEGDGDFVFEASILEEIDENSKVDEDILIEIPSLEVAEKIEELADKTKKYLSDERYRIKLEDLVNKEIKRVITFLNGDNFSAEDEINIENIIARLNKYENIFKDLQKIIICISYWGNENSRHLIEKIISRIGENLEGKSGKRLWLELNWYPLMLLTFSGGISAIAGQNHKNLKTLLYTEITERYRKIKRNVMINGQKAGEYARNKIFKSLYKDEKFYTPRSEYLYKQLQSEIEDLLFLGRMYERNFDRFEVFFALVYADIYEKQNQYGEIWGPQGRFVWKYKNRHSGRNCFIEIKEDALEEKGDWLPIKCGFFDGSFDRFIEIIEKFENKFLKN